MMPQQNNSELGGKKARRLRQRINELETKNIRLESDAKHGAKTIADLRGTIVKQEIDMKSLNAQLTETQKKLAIHQRLLETGRDDLQKQLDKVRLEKTALEEQCKLKDDMLSETEKKCGEYENEIVKLKLLLEKATKLTQLDRNFKYELAQQIRTIRDLLHSTWWWNAKSIALDFLEWIERYLTNLDMDIEEIDFKEGE